MTIKVEKISTRKRRRITGLPLDANGKPLPSPGRPKGVPNKLTKTLKAMILGALDDLGGQAWLVKQARRDPKPFISLLGRVLPNEVKVPAGTNVVVLDWAALLGGPSAQVQRDDDEDVIDVTPSKPDAA